MSITLGGKRPEDFPGLKIRINSQMPAMPEIRNKTMEVAGKHGLIDFGATLGPRQFELVCVVVNADSYTLQRSLRALAAHLLDGKGRPKTMQLIFDEESDVFYNVRLSGHIPVERLLGLGQFTIPLIAYDPYAYLIYDTVELDADSEVFIDRDMTADAQYNYYIITGPTTLQIDNFGTQNAEPIIDIFGDWTTLTLSLGTDTLTVTEASTGMGGATLKVDCAKFTAKAGSVNKLSKIGGTFLSLPPGVSAISVNGTGLNCGFTFRFRPKFI